MITQSTNFVKSNNCSNLFLRVVPKPQETEQGIHRDHDEYSHLLLALHGVRLHEDISAKYTRRTDFFSNVRCKHALAVHPVGENPDFESVY